MNQKFSPKTVVVGIDGSQGALRAARWAVAEAAGTDSSLQLVYCGATDSPGDPSGEELSVEATRDACAAIHAMRENIDVRVESVEGQPITALIEASRHAGLLCVGHTETGNICGSGFGISAAKLVESAYCPVAVIRGEHHVNRTDHRAVVALVDGSPDDDAVLDWGFAEASRRAASLMLLTAYRTGFDLLQNESTLRAHDGRMQSVLDRHVAVRAPLNPDVELHTLNAFTTFLGYLTEHAMATQLAVISAQKTSEIYQLFGASGAVASNDSDFSLLVVR